MVQGEGFEFSGEKETVTQNKPIRQTEVSLQSGL